MANISKLNLTGADLDIADAYVRSLIPSTADPNTNMLATMADVSGGGGGGGDLTYSKIYTNPNPDAYFYSGTYTMDVNFFDDFKALLFVVKQSDASNLKTCCFKISREEIVYSSDYYFNIYMSNLTGGGDSFVRHCNYLKQNNKDCLNFSSAYVINSPQYAYNQFLIPVEIYKGV